MKFLAQGRTLVAVIVTVLVCGAATAGAARFITGADVKNGSLSGLDLRNGSVGRGELSLATNNAMPSRIAGDLPTKGFSATNDSVTNTNDGVEFGPYTDGGAAGGSSLPQPTRATPRAATSATRANFVDMFFPRVLLIKQRCTLAECGYAFQQTQTGAKSRHSGKEKPGRSRRTDRVNPAEPEGESHCRARSAM